MLASGAQVLPHIRPRRPDLLVLDLMLPGLHGLEVCQAIRRDPATADPPIIVVTARAEESDRVAGLELGADDYLTKPFSPKELVARVGALLRRAGAGRPAPDASATYGPITIDRDRHLVTDDGREVALTAKEFLLLDYFIQHRRPCPVARSAAVGGLGIPVHGRHADRRRPREAAAREDPPAGRRARDGQAIRLQAGGRVPGIAR